MLGSSKNYLFLKIMKKLITAGIAVTMLLSGLAVFADETSPTFTNSPKVSPSRTPKVNQQQKKAELEAKKARERECRATKRIAEQDYQNALKNARQIYLAALAKARAEHKAAIAKARANQSQEETRAANQVLNEAKKAAQKAWEEAKRAARQAFAGAKAAAKDKCARLLPTASPTPTPNQ